MCPPLLSEHNRKSRNDFKVKDRPKAEPADLFAAAGPRNPHSALPMTYSIAGYRAVISSGAYAYMWEQAAVLGGVAIVMMALTLIYFKVLLKKGKIEEQHA